MSTVVFNIRKSASMKVLRFISSVFMLCLVLSFSFTPLACAQDYYIPAPSGGTSSGTRSVSSSYNASDDTNDIVYTMKDDDSYRSSNGIISQLSTDTHNPYNGQVRLVFDIGAEFAEYQGDDVTEGIVVKVSPGDSTDVPVLKARKGYYFVGWCQGGVPKEPTWNIDTRTIEVSDELTESKNARVYALYANDEGDGYCTCGAYEQGIYKDALPTIKERYATYLDDNAARIATFTEKNDLTSGDVRNGAGYVLFVVLPIFVLLMTIIRANRESR